MAKKYTAIFQRSECPFTQITETFHDVQIKIFGERYECFGCGTNHYAGHRAMLFTYLIGNGHLEMRPLPLDNEARIALLAECGIVAT